MYKILEQNGVENENIDGGAFNNFAAGGRDGIIAGVLTECALAATGNSISISSGLLIICGIRVKITSAEVLSISVPPVSPTSYQIIAEVTLQSNGDMAVSFYLRSPAALQQDMLYSQGYGTYQAEIGSFVYNPDGSITNIVRTIDVLYGGSGSGANIEIGTVTTSTLPAGTDAEFDVTVRKPDGTRKTVLDIMACIPQGRDGAPGSDGKDGQNGTTFTPHIDDSGNLSWTNDGDKQNPAAVNIKGAPGLAGEDGEIALTLVVLYPDEVKKGGVYRFASAEFNRTPHTGERFNFFTAANQMGTGEVRSGIEWECVEVVSTKGDTGTPQLFLKSIIDKSPSTITAYWFDYTEFNRTPVVGDICSSTWGHNGKSWLVNGEITELRNGNEARYDITSMVETTGETGAAGPDGQDGAKGDTGAAGAGFWETTAEIPTTADGLTIDISQTSLTRAPVEGDFLISKAAATVFNVGQVIATAPDSMKVNYFASLQGSGGKLYLHTVTIRPYQINKVWNGISAASTTLKRTTLTFTSNPNIKLNLYSQSATPVTEDKNTFYETYKYKTLQGTMMYNGKCGVVYITMDSGGGFQEIYGTIGDEEEIYFIRTPASSTYSISSDIVKEIP